MIVGSWDDGHAFSIDKLGGNKGKDGIYEWGRLACGDLKGSWVKLRNRGQWIVTVLEDPKVCCSFCKAHQNIASQKSLVCRGCKKTIYCNEVCQINHWKAGHMKECNDGVDRVCGFCGSSGPGFKICSGCSEVFYCSKDCQEQDWEKHQENCY